MSTPPPELDDSHVEMFFKAFFDYLDKKNVYYDNEMACYAAFDKWCTKFVIDVNNNVRKEMIAETKSNGTEKA